jgi:hypothetical protein
MKGQSMDVTNMLWQPALLRLTCQHPEVNGGKQMAAYIAPQAITVVRRVAVVFGSPEDPNRKYPAIDCTEVFYCHGVLHVLETPEEVARLRDLALGHERPKPKAV